ncbi:MAG: DUF2110 family protein [Methanosarcinaceae archaeon]|nr:DUF2110 family protein [Methanosarcinaceae archaeon]MDD4331210.1 DUF2110 family protein [Methanosarcinaceae archaeon]
MKTIVILQPVYGNQKRAIRSLKALIDNELKALEVECEISVTPEGWAELQLEGEDEEVSANFLHSKYGSPVKKAEVGKLYKGFIKAVEEAVIIVDIGFPVKLGAEELKGLGRGKPKQLAARFGIIPFLPVEVEILERKKELRGSFSKEQLDRFWAWKKAGTDRVIVNSATRSELKSAIKKTRHGRDIYEIERLGLLEHAVVCRESTDGPGIVAAIGPLLKSQLGVVIGKSE